jgi:hypothetical protein
MPTRDEVITNLISILAEIQTMSGRDMPSIITPELKPLCDLDGFESINAAEATVMLIEKLHLKHLNDIPFFPPKGKDYLSIKQIADEVIKAEQR